MYYYEIWVGSQRFHSTKALTYSSNDKHIVGEIVVVPLRNQRVVGFIDRAVSVKPDMAPKVKPVEQTTGVILPPPLRKLHRWLQDYYPAPSGTITNLFLPGDTPKDKQPPVVASHPQKVLPNLTKDQQQALQAINSAPGSSILLHGATGSGKTRVYIELAKETLSKARSVIILTPEIGLTPQLIQSFTEVFSEEVITLHSHLTAAQRRDSWYKIARSNKPLIVIGPRSALFAPLKEVGLIVVDESHEQSYKQEQAPYYQTTRVAAQLARIHAAKCIFGSATPLVSDYYLFEQKKMPIVRMTHPASGAVAPPSIKLVNLKDPQERSGSLSRTLQEAIRVASNNGQQTLLFLNRRGSARMVLCQNCGWQAECPNCDVPLTYHADQYRLLCHICGFNRPIVTSCPVCQSSDVLYNTPGTKSLEQEVNNLFPELAVKRFDSDNLSDEKLERHFDQLRQGHVDVIIGTQIVTKGLDLPHLGLVGIVNADASLNFPDYTAEERTYQLLTQVIGRVGRHQNATNVILQTYNPDHSILQLAVRRDWPQFVSEQLHTREQFGFPPFYHVLQLKIARASRSAVSAAANKLADELKSMPGIKVRGPSPQLHERLRGKYNWQVIVSSKQRDKLLEVINHLPSGWQYNIDPNDLM